MGHQDEHQICTAVVAPEHGQDNLGVSPAVLPDKCLGICMLSNDSQHSAMTILVCMVAALTHIGVQPRAAASCVALDSRLFKQASHRVLLSSIKARANIPNKQSLSRWCDTVWQVQGNSLMLMYYLPAHISTVSAGRASAGAHDLRANLGAGYCLCQILDHC